MVQEIRRKCSNCGKVWHSLASREAQINLAQLEASCSTLGNCCGANSQNMRNMSANRDSLAQLRTCPECKSANYTEEIVGEE
jgi:hypothetical protein